MKIVHLTQRPIQTLNLIYLLGNRDIFFDHIFYCSLKKKNSLGFRDEGSSSWQALKHQCKILKIPFTKISKIEDIGFQKKIKKIKADSMISLVVDTIYNKKIISMFKKGIYSPHGGMLPHYRGSDCVKWALINNEKFVGISLQKIDAGIDTGKIIKVSKLNVKDFNNLDDIDQKLYYKFKLFDFVDLIQKLKKNKRIKFLKKNQRGKQYFKMHKILVNIVRKKFK